jgi:hypothetical protein
MDERIATDQGSRPAPVALPFDRIRWLVPAMVVCLVAMAMFMGFLIESLRGDQETLSFRIPGLPISDTEIAHNHGRLVRDSTAIIGFGTLAALMGLVWQYRAHANLRRLVSNARFHPPVAVAVWFIPGVNLIASLLALLELTWTGVPREEGWRSGWLTALVVGWWLVVLTSVGLALWSFAPVLHDQTLQDLFVRDHRAVIAAGIGIIAVLLTVPLIVVLDGRVTQREDRLRLGEWRGWGRRDR